MYQVIGKDGQVSEPLDVNSLQSMAQENRLEPHQMLIDPISGRTFPAGELIAFSNVRAAYSTPMPPVSSGMTQMPPPIMMPPVAQPDSSLLALRLGGYIIDLLCSLPLLLLALIPFVGIVFAPLLVLYWLSRDSFFKGQSLGKKAVGLKVVRLDGRPVDWLTSVQRNIVFVPLLLEAIPFVGMVLTPEIFGLINIVEIVLVLATQRRIGDNIAKTVVVQA